TGTLTVSNSTLSGNSASHGGGIYNTGTLTVTQSTIYGNSGDGIYGPVTLVNSIVQSVTGTASGHNNLIANGTGPAGIHDRGVGTQVGADPHLGPLQNNGGSEPTMALLAGSPALGAGGALTALAQNAGSTNQSLAVYNAAAFAATPGPFFILIDGEEMKVTNVN